MNLSQVCLLKFVSIFSFFQKNLLNMTAEPKSKRQRIMIISGDDSVIDELQKNSQFSLCKTIVLETINEDIQVSNLTVKSNLFY